MYSIPDRDGKVYFPEVFWPIMHAVFGTNNLLLTTNKFANVVLEEVTQNFPELLKFTPKLTLDQLSGNRLIGEEFGIRSAYEYLLE